jgi:hypothetical protein
MAQRIFYGLRYKKTNDVLYYYVENNEGKQYCCDESYYLTHKHSQGKEMWLTDKYETAVVARWTSEEWYSAHYDTPVNPYHAKDLEVVKVVTLVGRKLDDIEDQVAIVNKHLTNYGYAELDEDYVDEVRIVEDLEEQAEENEESE